MRKKSTSKSNPDKKPANSVFQKLLHFIKYHNAFSIIFMVVFVGFSISLAASPEFRENFVSSHDTVRSLDNSRIASADLDSFNFKLRIKSVTENEINYYIIYTYQTLAIKDYIWQELGKETTLTVNKRALGGKDLGLYVAEELGEVINYELSYLKEVQQIENQKGLTQKIVTTQYAGLIGKFLEPKEKVFPGYEPVVQPPEPEELAVQSENEASSLSSESMLVPVLTSEPEPTSTPTPASEPIKLTIDREEIRQIVLELLAQQRTERTVSAVSIEIEGCIDSSALNYNPEATVDPGLCEYDLGGSGGGEPELEPEILETTTPGD